MMSSWMDSTAAAEIWVCLGLHLLLLGYLVLPMWHRARWLAQHKDIGGKEET